MITKQEIANILKNYVESDVSIFANRMPNKINNQAAKKVISVGDSNLDAAAQIKTGEYDQKSFKLTIRYNENEAESEIFSNSLYQAVLDIQNVTINSTDTWQFTLRALRPVSTGKVKDNIYEYQIEFTIIYSMR